MQFELTVLGSNSALPAQNRYPTSQYLNIRNNHILIDCGEAAQIQLNKYKIKSSKIDKIFISHLHGDHFYGLPGLLSSFNLNRRTDPLMIFAPPGLKEIIETMFSHTKSSLNYSLEFQEIVPKNGLLIYEDEEIEVRSLEMIHRIPCCGFVFKEKKEKRKINKEKIEGLEMSHEWYIKLKEGADYIDKNDKRIPNDELTDPPPQQRTYAYCTDTAYNEKIIPFIEGVDILYHEATFKKDKAERALETYHSTTVQAAEIAKKAGVKKLLIGHYSSRYEDLTPLQNECREVFENTELALEGNIHTLPRIFQ
ncbi:MAG: ribonuclease Z [Chitinophagales bacterium]